MRPGVKSSSSLRKLSMRKILLLLGSLAVAAGAVLVLPGSAGADAFSPEAGPTKNAVDTDTLYKIVFFMGLTVIAIVWGILFYTLVRFRARHRRTPPQIRGNSTLELGWTIGASLIVTAIGIITLI